MSMTESEAKEILNRIATRNMFCTLEEESLNAFYLAEVALEEIQQYRAIGTVGDVDFYKKCYDEESYEYCGEYGTDFCGCEKRMKYLEKKIAEYEAIGTVEEFRRLNEYKAKMEMQYLDDINNPLEPLKLSSALQSEIRKYEYRKEHMPQDISPLDYTIMYALKHCLEEQMTED